MIWRGWARCGFVVMVGAGVRLGSWSCRGWVVRGGSGGSRTSRSTRTTTRNAAFGLPRAGQTYGVDVFDLPVAVVTVDSGAVVVPVVEVAGVLVDRRDGSVVDLVSVVVVLGLPALASV